MCNQIKPYFVPHGVDLDIQPISEEGFGFKAFVIKFEEYFNPITNAICKSKFAGPFTDTIYEPEKDGYIKWWKDPYLNDLAFCFFLTEGEAQSWASNYYFRKIRDCENRGYSYFLRKNFVIKKIHYRKGLISRFEFDSAIQKRIALCHEFKILEV